MRPQVPSLSYRTAVPIAVAVLIALLSPVSGMQGSAGAGVQPDQVWGLKSLAPAGQAPSSAPARLFWFDEAATTFVDLGAVTLNGVQIDVDGLVELPSGGLRAFQVTAAGSTMISLAPGPPPVATAAGPLLAGRDIRGAVAIGALELLAIDAASNSLIRIAVASGTMIGAPIPLTLFCAPFNLGTSTDIAMGSDGLLVIVDMNTYFAVSPTSGRLAPLLTDTAPLPGSATVAFAGLAFGSGGSASTLFAYEINGPDDIVAYDTAASFARTTLFTNIIPAFNAGRGDLATWVAATPAEPPLRLYADLNGDGAVNGADLGQLLAVWGQCAACPADLNCDGVVDGADLGIMLSVWG